MAQDSIHNHGRSGAPVDRTVGYTGRHTHPSGFILTQMNASQALLLQHNQIEAAADHQQLIGLMAMAEEFTSSGTVHFSDPCFITG